MRSARRESASAHCLSKLRNAYRLGGIGGASAGKEEIEGSRGWEPLSEGY